MYTNQYNYLVERPSITDAPVEPVPDQIIVSPNEEDPLPVDDDKKDENVKLVSVIDETVPELSADLDNVPTAVAVEASIVNDDEEPQPHDGTTRGHPRTLNQCNNRFSLKVLLKSISFERRAGAGE